jgi:endonuclease/exonuclease/phosphatase (EEP) superfamily protein YafD
MTAKNDSPRTKAGDASSWRSRGRKLLFPAIALQLVAVVVFAIALRLGETTQPTLLALYAPRQPVLLLTVLATLAAPFTQRRRLLVPVQLGTLVFVLFAVMGLSVGRPVAGEHAVRLATYNVYFGKLGHPELFAEIAAMPEDVVLIQAPWPKMADDLRERFPDRTTEAFEDFVIVTRLRIKDVIKPEHLEPDVPAQWVGWVLESPSGPVTIYNVHPFSPRNALFGDGGNSENTKRREAQIASAVAAAHAGVGPFVLIGDTNLPEPSPIARRSFAGLRDAFEETGFGFGYTFPSKRPWMRIDRAFAGEGIHFLDARVGRRGASDHRPLFVDFEIERSNAHGS